MKRATELTLSAEYQARLGNLEKAVRLNPYYTAAWLELAEIAEAGGDYPKAEKAYVDASHIDRTFEPAWALANFYFRRQRWEDFWKWMRSAMEMSYGDRTAIFNLCWRASQDSELILSRAVPSERTILSDYVYFLTTTDRVTAAAAVAARLIPMATIEDLPRLLLLCDLLIEKENDATSAMRTWNALIAHRSIDYGPLNSEQGASLTNGAFRVQPLSHGFDWRLLPASNVRSLWSENSPGLQFHFDGHQPEQTDFLLEWIPVRPSTTYELVIHAQAPARGFLCKIETPARRLLAEVPMEAAPTTRLHFATARENLVRLVFAYRRAQGTSRASGALLLPSVELRWMR